jgi:hypothetical protein
MELIAVVAVIFLVAVQLAWATKIDLAYLFAPAIFFIVGWEFIFGLLGKLNLGMESLVLFIGMALILLLAKSGGFRNYLVRSIYAPSTVAFVSLSLISLYKSKDWMLSQWDEFTHWGAVVKAMHEFAMLGPATPVDLVASRYPPSISLFQYFVMDFNTRWQEGLLFWSIHLIAISIIVSVLAKCSYKYLAEIFFRLFIALVAASLFFNIFDNIYSDPTLAIAFGFMVAVAIQASYLDGRWTCLLALSAVFVTLIKPIGIYFAASAILINAVATMYTVRFGSGRRAFLAFSPSFFASAAALIAWTAWTDYVLKYEGSIASPVDTLSVSVRDANNVQQITDSYISAFSNINLRPSYSVAMTSLTWTIVCGLFFVMWAALSGNKRRKQNIGIGVTLLIATGGYFGVVLYAYLSSFGPGEAAGLASYSRYIGTWFQGIFLAIILLILSEFYIAKYFESGDSDINPLRTKSLRVKLGIFLVAVMAVTTLSSVHNYMLMLSVSRYQGSEVRAPLSPVLQAIDNAKIPEGSRVWIITQHQIGFEYYVLRYEMQNSRFEFGEKPFSVGTPYGDDDIWTAPDRNLDVWSNELRDWDYLVLYQTTESFNKQFASLFQPSFAESNSVYRIIKTKDSVNLSKVS